MADVYSYTDFRKFLLDSYSERKKANPAFSYRHIAAKCGINVGNFASMLKGQRNLTIEIALRLAKLFKLNKRERQYFQYMVLYCQAKNHDDKKRYFEEMISFKESKVRVLDADQYEFYDKWYYTAVREVLEFYPFNGSNATKLGKMLIPAISGHQVTKAIHLLDSLGLIEKDSKGFYRRVDAIISTGNDARSLAANNFALNTMKLAGEALNRVPGQLNISWASLCIAEEDFSKVEEEIRACRRRILEIAKASNRPDRVYQINIQAFPLTEKYRKD